MITRWKPGQKRRAASHKREHIINSQICKCYQRAPSDFCCPWGSRVQPMQGSDSSCRARDMEATMLDHLRHRGETATKTVKFFIAHSKLYYMQLSYKNWLDALNFTSVVQQILTVTNRAESLRNHFVQLTQVELSSCQNPKTAHSEAILCLIS